jgi:hypothetical protein
MCAKAGAHRAPLQRRSLTKAETDFVINGDAELVHVLAMGDDKVSRIQSTTIEDIEHRDKLLALEGGQEAFLKREHRYGIG